MNDIKTETVIDNLIATVFNSDFKPFIHNMGENVSQSVIHKCIDAIKDFNEDTILDCLDVIDSYSYLLKDEYENYFTLANQFLCFQIYQNIDSLTFTEETSIYEKIRNMYRKMRLVEILNDITLLEDL